MIKPNEDFVLVLVDKESESPNSLIVPKEHSDTFFGTVENMGPGRILESGKHIRPKFNVGDRVILPTGAGRSLFYNKASYVFVHATEILGLLEEAHVDPYDHEVINEGV